MVFSAVISSLRAGRQLFHQLLLLAAELLGAGCDRFLVCLLGCCAGLQGRNGFCGTRIGGIPDLGSRDAQIAGALLDRALVPLVAVDVDRGAVRAVGVDPEGIAGQQADAAAAGSVVDVVVGDGIQLKACSVEQDGVDDKTVVEAVQVLAVDRRGDVVVHVLDVILCVDPEITQRRIRSAGGVKGLVGDNEAVFPVRCHDVEAAGRLVVVDLVSAGLAHDGFKIPADAAVSVEVVLVAVDILPSGDRLAVLEIELGVVHEAPARV